MGDKILKKLTLTLILASVAFAQTSFEELKWVDKEIEEIKPPRQGASVHAISLLKSPFVFLEKNKTKEKTKAARRAATPPSIVPQQRCTSTTNAQKRVAVRHIKRKGLSVSAIINNTALINGKWYKVGDRLGRYKVAKITLQDVVLKSSTKTVTLSTKTNKLNSRMKK